MPMFGRKITPMLGKGKHGFKINYILLLFITHHYLLRTYIPPKDHAKCLRGNEKHTSSWLPRICRILELIMMAIILFAHNFTDYKGLWDLNSGLFGYFFFLGNWELKQPGGLWPHTHPNKTRDQGHARRQRYHGETQQGNISYKAHLGSPKCRQHGEPRRTGSLGWKSNQGRHHGQEKQWRKDMHRWRCPDRPQRIGDQRPGAWALIWNGFMSGRWLSQATSTSLAILAHLWIFQMCLPFLPLCLSSIGCFWNTLLQFLHNTAKSNYFLKTFCLLTITYTKVTKTWHATLFPNSPALLSQLLCCPFPLYLPFSPHIPQVFPDSPRQKRLPFACVLSPFALCHHWCVTKLYTFQFLKLWGHFKQGFCLIHLCVDSAKGGYPSGNVQKVMYEWWMDGLMNKWTYTKC